MGEIRRPGRNPRQGVTSQAFKTKPRSHGAQAARQAARAGSRKGGDKARRKG